MRLIAAVMRWLRQADDPAAAERAVRERAERSAAQERATDWHPDAVRSWMRSWR